MNNEKNQKKEYSEIGISNPIFNHLLKYQTWYILSLTFILLLTPLISNLFFEKPLLMGGESYYNLLNSEKIKFSTAHYLPIVFMKYILSDQLLILVPLLLGIVTIYLFFLLIEQIDLPKKFSFFFIFLLILSPSFIYTFSTLSMNSFWIFLVVLSFFLLSNSNDYLKYLSIVPFFLSTFFDLFSSLIVFLLLMIYFAKNKRPFITSILTGYSLLSVIQWIFNQTFVNGPFHSQKLLQDLIADLGGLSGISFFTIILAIIGVAITWKRKKLYFAYIFIPLIIPTYFFNSQVIFPLTILASFFAAVGIVKLFERQWNLITIKKYTFLLLILGIFFSTIVFLDRINETYPTTPYKDSLTWIKDNTGDKEIVFSEPENSYYIQYFSQREPFNKPHEKDAYKNEITMRILNSTYIAELEPLVDDNNLSILYITPEMKEKLPKEQGLIFLFKNEKFILIHSEKDIEVWKFKK